MPRLSVGTQRFGDRKVQRTREFVFGTCEVLAAEEKNATIEMRFARHQVLRYRERRPRSKIVVGERFRSVAGNFARPRPQVEGAGRCRVEFERGVECGDRSRRK